MYTKYTRLVSLWLPLGIPYGLEPSLCSYLIVGSLHIVPKVLSDFWPPDILSSISEVPLSTVVTLVVNLLDNELS